MTGRTRRDIICSGGASALSALTAGLLRGNQAARAPALQTPIPEVDSVAVCVVVDSYQVAVAPGGKVGSVEIQRFGWGITESQPPNRTLISEFGLSMHASARRGSEVRSILMDFGFTGQALNNNLELIAIDPASLDALLLSHGHYDHFGGMVGFFKQHKRRLRRGIPMYLGGEDCFCAREWTAAPAKGNFGVIDRKALRDANVTITFTDRPAAVADFGFATGHIETTSFERVLSPSAAKPGWNHGNGCSPDLFSDEERRQGLVPDKFNHEIALAFNLKGRGLVVLTACSHRGVVNTVQRAQTVSGVQKVHAVIGGFHLVPFDEAYLRQTVAALKQMDVDYVIPLHCSGEPFYELAKTEMPSKLQRSYTGTRFVFSA